jgi:methionyl-tRNA formyltransferase
MRYIFIGNRQYVLEEMLRLGLYVAKILVIKDSFLHRTLLKDQDYVYEVIHSKKQLLEILNSTDYDVLISNGCKYVLPISELKKAKYINIHPAYLPDLRGRDPVNAALLFGRDIGATCHYMNDGIDTGDIISQVLIPYTEDLDAALLFQLCFQAEVEAFRLAYNKEFSIKRAQPVREDSIYYTQKFQDRLIDFDEDVVTILRRIKAYGYQSKGCFFNCNGHTYKFFSGEKLHNDFLVQYSTNFSEREVIFAYEDCIVFKKDYEIIKFSRIEGNVIEPHDIVETCSSVSNILDKK